MRISDWSSDVCSSDLPPDARDRRLRRVLAALTRIRVGNLPRESELAAAPRLDAWTVLPVTPGPVLLGIVSGHPHLREGARIAMSPLLWLAPDRRSARTVSR